MSEASLVCVRLRLLDTSLLDINAVAAKALIAHPSWNVLYGQFTSLDPRSKTNPSVNRFQYREVIYTPDEV